jgi:hypothetical protein
MLFNHKTDTLACSPPRRPSPPFRGEREGPRRASGGEGEVGSATHSPTGPLTLPSPPAGGGEG